MRSTLSLDTHEKFDQICEAFGIAELYDHDIDRLPYTIRKRIGLASAVIVPMPWYIFDEPTLGQDDNSVDAVAQMFEKLARAGAGIIVITHAEVLRTRLAGKRLFLQDGQLNLTD